MLEPPDTASKIRIKSDVDGSDLTDSCISW